MKLAKGSKSWILSAFVPGLFFMILYLFFYNVVLGSIFLFFSIALFLLTGFFLLFFRDPERKVGKGIVVCADGKIREIIKFKDEEIGDCICISTFMNVYNVHVNRMPVDGVIKSIVHLPGGHLPAFKKESIRNERVVLTIESKIGIVRVVQIAGTLARRIIPYVKEGDKLKKGEKIGIIRLGSRVDVYLPSEKIRNVCVRLGDRVIAGEDCLAEVND